MLRRNVLRAGVTAGAVATVGCLGGSDGPAFHDGFETDIGDWEGDAAIGPEIDVADFEWEFGVSAAEAAEGDTFLRIWNEGTYDDGVTWGVHPVSVTSGEAYREVTVQFWSESESFNTIRDAVMRLGPEPPEVEEDFPHPGVNTTQLGETSYGGLREPLWLAGVHLRVDNAGTVGGHALRRRRDQRRLGGRRDPLRRRRHDRVRTAVTAHRFCPAE